MNDFLFWTLIYLASGLCSLAFGYWQIGSCMYYENKWKDKIIFHLTVIVLGPFWPLWFIEWKKSPG
ncbi:hypothetical protein CL634_00740 [bacterium]|nr:hypothetical protein [bacterium]